MIRNVRAVGFANPHFEAEDRRVVVAAAVSLVAAVVLSLCILWSA